MTGSIFLLVDPEFFLTNFHPLNVTSLHETSLNITFFWKIFIICYYFDS